MFEYIKSIPGRVSKSLQLARETAATKATSTTNGFVNATHALLRFIEENAAGCAIAWVFFTIARFVQPQYDVAFLVVVGGVLFYFKDYSRRRTWLTALVLSWFLLFLGEPSGFVLGAVGVSVLLLVELVRRYREEAEEIIFLPKRINLPFGKSFEVPVAFSLFWRKAAIVVLPVLLGAAVFAFYGLAQFKAVPLIQPVALQFAKIAPVVFALFGIVVEGFATLRAPSEDESNHWLATPVMYFLFALLFLPTHSNAGAAVVIIVGIALSIFAYIDRSTIDKPHRSHKTFVAVTVVNLAFCGWFYVANHWDWFYKYQMANAMHVTKLEKMPRSTRGSHRIVPIVTAPDFCTEANDDAFAQPSPNPRPIFINKEGKGEHLYWECPRQPTRVQNHLLTYPAGGVDGVVLVDGGKKGRFSTVVDVQFVYGEDSPVTKAAFFVRHPFSEAQPGVIGRTIGGDYYLVIPYTSWGLQWGGMIPVFSGVMVVSQSGIITDMMPAAAGEMFPGVPLYPTALARQYAQLWAENSSWWAQQWSGELLEISDSGNPEDNLYPNYQSFVTGKFGMIPFEPKGKNATAIKAIGLIDRVTGDMQVYFRPQKKNHDVSSSAEDQELPGPKQIIGNVSSVHPGQNNLKLNGATIATSEHGKLHWVSALMQTNVAQNHGFANGILFDEHAEHGMDVNTAEDIDAVLDREDAEENAAEEAAHPKHVAPVAKVEAPLAKVEAPVAKVEAPLAKVEAPLAKVEALLAKVEAPVAKVEAPVAKVEAPVAKVEAPFAKIEAPVAKVEAPLAETPVQNAQPAANTVPAPMLLNETKIPTDLLAAPPSPSKPKAKKHKKH